VSEQFSKPKTWTLNYSANFPAIGMSLQENENSDCLPCRVTGTIFSTGVGLYLLNESKFQRKQFHLIALGTVFIGLGIKRAIGQ
jgi:hypothetical protein